MSDSNVLQFPGMCPLHAEVCEFLLVESHFSSNFPTYASFGLIKIEYDLNNRDTRLRLYRFVNNGISRDSKTTLKHGFPNP